MIHDVPLSLKEINRFLMRFRLQAANPLDQDSRDLRDGLQSFYDERIYPQLKERLWLHVRGMDMKLKMKREAKTEQHENR